MFNKYFGLSENPFSLLPEYSYFSFDAIDQDVSRNILADLAAGREAIVVTGELGSGKTLFLRNLLIQLPPELPSFAYSCSNLQEDLTTDCLMSGLDILRDCQDTPPTLQVRIEQFGTLHPRGQRLLLVVDDAHELDDESLNLLLYKAANSGEGAPYFQLILCGEEHLEPRVRHLSLAYCLSDPLVRSYRLQGLPENAVADYIRYRFRQAGYRGQEEIFDMDAIKAIAVYSGGIPRKIHLLCGASLVVAEQENRRTITSKIVDEAAQICLLSPAKLELTNASRSPDSSGAPSLSINAVTSHPSRERRRTTRTWINQENHEPIATRIHRLRLLPSKHSAGLAIFFAIYISVGSLVVGYYTNLVESPLGSSASDSSPQLSAAEGKFTATTPQEFQQIPTMDSTTAVMEKTDGADPLAKDELNNDVRNASPIDLNSPEFSQAETPFPATDPAQLSTVPVSYNEPDARLPGVKANGESMFKAADSHTKKMVLGAFQIAEAKTDRAAQRMGRKETSSGERIAFRHQLEKFRIACNLKSLIKAAKEGSLTKVELLLASGIAVNGREPKSGMTPLLSAASAGQVHIVRALLQNGASPNLKGYDGLTASMAAARNRHSEVKQMLLKAETSPIRTDRQAVKGSKPVNSSRETQPPIIMLAKQGTYTNKRLITEIGRGSSRSNHFSHEASSENSIPFVQ